VATADVSGCTAAVCTHHELRHILQCLYESICLLQLATALKFKWARQCCCHKVAGAPEISRHLQQLQKVPAAAGSTMPPSRRAWMAHMNACTRTHKLVMVQPMEALSLHMNQLTSVEPPGMAPADPTRNATPAGGQHTHNTACT
jgi:hypothetical protein